MSRQAVLDSWSRWWLWGAVALSAFCLVATLIPFEAVRGTPLRYIKMFSTSGENSIGAWWSGMLLLIAGLHAFDGYLRHRATHALIAHGWLAFSVLMVILSMDEVASLHERIPHGMILLALLAVCLGGFAILSLFLTERRTAIWLATGFFILAVALVQDDLLNGLAYWETHQSLRATLEEATELAAMLVFIRISMENTVDGFHPGDTNPAPLLDAVDYFRVAAVAVALVLAPLAALYSAGLTDLVERGNPSIWLSSAAFLLAGMAAFRFAAREARMSGWKYLALGGLCGVMSVASVAVNAFAYENRNHLIFSAGCAASLMLWMLLVARERQQRESYVLLSAICASLLLVSWVQDNLVMTYWVEATIAAIVLYGNASLDKVLIPKTRVMYGAAVQGAMDSTADNSTHPTLQGVNAP